MAGTESWSQEVKFRSREVSCISSHGGGKGEWEGEMRSGRGTWGQAAKDLDEGIELYP